MFNKYTLVVAATITAAFAGSASADVNYIIESGAFKGQTIELDMVRSEGAGNVVVYDYRLGEMGRELAAKTVHSGANSNVRLHIGHGVTGAVIAVLHDAVGTPVATEVIKSKN